MVNGGKNMIGVNTMIKRVDKIDATEFNDEKVMMDIEKGKYYALNEVGSSIWDKIESTISVSDIVEKLLEEYDVSKEQCTEEVLNYLNNLEKEKLIEVYE